MDNVEPTHVAFADESHHNTGRFRGVAIVSLKAQCRQELSNRLATLREESNVKEVHWKELNGAKERFCAGKWAKQSLDWAKAGRLRVDVLSWDTEDSRHKLPGRDDVENLHRMYHHLCKAMLVRRWPNEAVWKLHPDQNALMKWNNVHEWLDRMSVGGSVRQDLLTEGTIHVEFWDWFKLHSIEPVSSKTEPLVQLADLHVGMAIYSREHFRKLEAWREGKIQDVLFESSENDEIKLSGADRERCQLLHEFNEGCKANRLGVSLKSSKMLKTPNPANPVNFWWWEPQHDEDKAPVRANPKK